MTPLISEKYLLSRRFPGKKSQSLSAEMSLEDDDDHDRAAGEVLSELEPLEDLDDAEFGLPPVDNPPTLEEILAEDDDLPRTVDDFDEDGSSFGGFNDISGGHLAVALHQLGIEGVKVFLYLKV